MKQVISTSRPLSADQLRIAEMYAAMDDRQQELALVRMARLCAKYPRRIKPSLRLVGGVK